MYNDIKTMLVVPNDYDERSETKVVYASNSQI